MKAKLSNFYRAKANGTPSYTFNLYDLTDAELTAIKNNKGEYYRSDVEEINGQVVEVPRVTLSSRHGASGIGAYATDLIVTVNGSIVNNDIELFELEAALSKSPAMQTAVAQAQAMQFLAKKGLLGGNKRQQLNSAPVVNGSIGTVTETAIVDTF